MSSDAIIGGQSPFRVTAGLLVGAVRTRISGSGTPKQFPLWARRTRAWIIFTTLPALVVLPLFFLTFKQGQRDGLPLVPSPVLTRSGKVAYDAFGLLAIAGLLVTGVVIVAYTVLAGVVGRRRADGHGLGRLTLKVAVSAGLVAVAVAEGAVALFAVVALGFTVWGHVTVAREVKQGRCPHPMLRPLAPVPAIMAVLAVVGWISSEVVGPHGYLDRHGVDVPLNGHPALAHALVSGAATALAAGWLVTFVSLILIVGGADASRDELRLGRTVGTTVSVLLWVMAGAALISVLALESQGSPHHSDATTVTTSWGRLWVGGAVSLLVAAAVSTSGAVASWHSWRVTSRLET
ncbi:MAG: hypothetical protein ABSC41_11145 [Acidimicrobiales bacterium]